VESATDFETSAMPTRTNPTDTDEEYNVVAEPKTKCGKAIVWQCEVHHAEPEAHNCGSRWVDYAPHYNIVLEASYQASQTEVKISGPDELPGGDWDCDLGTCIQTNSETKIERRMRRVVVTMSG
jgi:hypothetical protein